MALQHVVAVGGRVARWDPRNSRLAILMGQATLYGSGLHADPALQEAETARAE